MSTCPPDTATPSLLDDGDAFVDVICVFARRGRARRLAEQRTASPTAPTADELAKDVTHDPQNQK